MSDTASNPPVPQVTALILAGGAGRRVGGEDKGLITWQGKPLVQHVHDRIAPQVAEVMISCNRNRERYARIASLAASDVRPGFQGPLAGLEAAIPALAGEFVLLVPCDTPLLPEDLAPRLAAALRDSPRVAGCYASSDGNGHYLCALLRANRLGSLPRFLDTGGRAVRHWYEQIGVDAVPFDDQPGSFLNLNRMFDSGS